MTAILAGITVLEVGNFLAAPFCTMQLADLGADVLKIENPDGGDAVRHSGPFLGHESSPFLRINRNKRSIALDLKTEPGRQIFKHLARNADVIVENLRPGAMEKLGLTYEVLVEENPGLIYLAASGWGQDGPYSQLPGLDIIVQGMSGIMSITGESKDRPPVKVGVPLCDLVCALYGALAVVGALLERVLSRRGQFLDVSLFESAVSLDVWEAGRYFANGETAEPLGSAHQTSAPYQAFKAKDGYFCMGATTQTTWRSFCYTMGLEHLLEDPRFSDNALRHRERVALAGEIESLTSQKPVQFWIDLLQRGGVPCGPIKRMEEVFTDEHLQAREFFKSVPHATLGDIEQMGSPMRFSRTPTRLDTAGPLLGEHTREVLDHLGFRGDEIEKLIRDRVVSVP